MSTQNKTTTLREQIDNAKMIGAKMISTFISTEKESDIGFGITAARRVVDEMLTPELKDWITLIGLGEDDQTVDEEGVFHSHCHVWFPTARLRVMETANLIRWKKDKFDGHVSFWLTPEGKKIYWAMKTPKMKTAKLTPFLRTETPL